MAGELIGALRVALGLDTAKFEDGFKKSRARAKAEVASIQKSIDGLKGRLDAVWVGVGGAALIAAARRSLDYASSLGEVAQQLGVTTKELQEYRFAATQVGISQEEMDKALAKLTRTIGEAKAGSKAQAEVFRELGVAVQDANGRVYTAGEVIPKLADALAKIEDPATRARLEVDLFGKSGQKLDTLLTQGSKGVNELRTAAQKLGVVLSDRQIQNADDTADKLSALKTVLEANIAARVANNAKAILTLANAVATLTQNGMELIGQYPRLSGALAGAAAGARLGPYGIAAGAAGGFAAGDYLGNASDDSNMDLGFRRERLRAARAEFRRRQDSAKDGGSIFAIRKSDSPRSGATIDSALAEFKRQTKLLEMAVGVQKSGLAPPKVTVEDGALPTVAAKGGGGPRGPSALDRARNFIEERSQLEMEQLGLKQDITSDLREQARLEHLRLENERAAYDFDLDMKVKAGELSAADAERLKIIANRNAELKATAVNWQLDDQLAQDALSVNRNSITTQLDMLRDQSSLARTTAERRNVELKILDLQLELEKISLDAVIAAHSSTETEKQIARARLDQLDKLRAGAVAGIEKSNMAPLAAYFETLPQTAAEVNEAFENIAANGVANMVDGLAEAGANVLKLKGFAGQLFNQLIADVIRLNIQSALGGGGGLLGAIGGLFGGSSLSSFVGGIAGQNSAALALKFPGLDGGGSFMAGGRGGIDRNVLSINGVPRVRVSADERITVDRARSDGAAAGRAFYFDNRGAVMTQDLLDQMNAIGAHAVIQGAAGGSAGAQRAIARRQSRHLA
jgi:hypothetical protein